MSIVIVPNQLKKEIIVEAPETAGYPKTGQEVTVHYTGKLDDGTVFDSSVQRNKPFEFVLGKNTVIKGWEQGVVTMKQGEKSRFFIEPEYGYGKGGSPPVIPANSRLTFEIELLDFRDKPKEKWEMTDGEREQFATEMNNKARVAVGNGEIERAAEIYEEAYAYVDFMENRNDKLLTQLCTNLAFCYLKLELASKCVARAEKAVELDSSNQKAHFRLGMGYLRQHNYEKALNAFEKMEDNQLKKRCKQKVQFAIKSDRIKEVGIFRGCLN
jgi:peptidylprolyl isomerase